MHPRFVSGYLTDRESAASYENVRNIATGFFGHVILAFSVPTHDSGVQKPRLNQRGLKETLQVLVDNGAELSLAIGGWQSREGREGLIQAWNNAILDVNKMATSLIVAVREIEQEIERPITGIDFDWEHPATQQFSAYMRLVDAVRAESQGLKRLTMAVPAYPQGSADGVAYRYDRDTLAMKLDHLHLMTYDNAGDWTGPEYHAAGTWAISTTREWQGAVGDNKMVSMGIPAYGLTFPGAAARGDKRGYTGSELIPVPFNQIPQSAITNDWDSLASWALLPGGWTSFVSPVLVAGTLMRFSHTPRFVWNMAGMTQSFVDALART